MAFTHETKPKMKKRRPIIKIEMMVSFFVRELTSIFFCKGTYINCSSQGFVHAMEIILW
jgi:hypothetical protein